MTPRTTRPIPEPIGRRLALTPIGLDIVAALAHDPDGLRLTPLSAAIASPVSSVQASLRILMANDLVARDDGVPPNYTLTDHPARAALINLAVVLPESVHAIALVLRASRAVAVATVDRDGFHAGLDPDAPAIARERLLASLEAIANARADAPPVHVRDVPDLTRIASVSVGFRARLTSAVKLKGQLDLGSTAGRVPSRDSIADTQRR